MSDADQVAFGLSIRSHACGGRTTGATARRTLKCPQQCRGSRKAYLKMVAEFSVECELGMDRGDFWRVKSSPAFFEFLVKNRAMTKMEVQKNSFDEELRKHELRCAYIPGVVDLPPAVRALIGESALEVIDQQTWSTAEPDSFSLESLVRPTFLTNQIKTESTLSLLPAEEEGKCRHVVEGKAEVNLPFIGWLVEDSILRNLRAFYVEYPSHVADFKAHMMEVVGERESDTVLVDDFLKHMELEKKTTQASASEETEDTEAAGQAQFEGLNSAIAAGTPNEAVKKVESQPDNHRENGHSNTGKDQASELSHGSNGTSGHTIEDEKDEDAPVSANGKLVHGREEHKNSESRSNENDRDGATGTLVAEADRNVSKDEYSDGHEHDNVVN